MIPKIVPVSTGIFLAIFMANTTQAGWQDFLKSTVDELSKSGAVTQAASSLLTNNEMADGLKEALANGVESAIKTLGKKDGFMKNSLVQIPLPDSLKIAEKTARNLGQGAYVDTFIGTMNHAAEMAVPEAAELLGEAIRKMSVEDATKILNGPDDAATQYFRKVSEAKLVERFQPIVQNATNQVGVTAAYKNLVGQAAPLLSGFIPTETLDIDHYVTQKSLDGLFKYIALEEKRIRENPMARTSYLLKKVFTGQ